MHHVQKVQPFPGCGQMVFDSSCFLRLSTLHPLLNDKNNHYDKIATEERDFFKFFLKKLCIFILKENRLWPSRRPMWLNECRRHRIDRVLSAPAA